MKKIYHWTILAWLFAVAFTCRVQAQQADPWPAKIYLTFDASGKLVSFPPAIVRDHRQICLRVVVPESNLLNQVRAFKSMLQEALDTLNARKDMYKCFFEGVKEFDFEKYPDSLKKVIDMIDDEHIDLNGIPNLITGLKPYTHIPASTFFTNLFHRQYEVGIYRGTTLIKPLKLDQLEYDKKTHCYYFTGACQCVKDLTCITCGSRANDELVFKLTGADPMDLTLQQWFETQNDSLGKLKPKELAKSLDSMAAAPAITGGSFGRAYSKLDPLKPWYPYWFWYTKGEVVLDPFGMHGKQWSASIKQSIADYGAAIDSIQQQKRFTDSTLAHLRFTMYNFPVFGYIQAIDLDLARQVADLTKKKKAAEQSLNNKSEQNPNVYPLRYLNKVSVFRTDFWHVRPQVQFDAASDYQRTAERRRQRHRVMEIPENEQPVLVVHNVDSGTTMKYGDANPRPFSDDEEFTTLIIKLLGEADPSGIASDAATNLQNVARSFASTTRKFELVEGGNPDCLNRLKPMFTHFQEMAKDYANNLLTFFYPSSPFSNAAPDKPVYSSVTKVVKMTDAPIRDSFPILNVINGKDSLMNQANLRIGKLVYVTVVAGLAMTDRAATVTTIDTTGSGFKVSSQDNKARAVLGFKIYPFQYYKRDRWLIPRYPLHRLSLFGGFEVLHPVNNFYVGGCYDIIPGLGFSVGANYYLQTKYKIENNVVVDTHRGYKNSGAYYAVVVNPLLFASFVKYLFKAL